MPRTNRGNDLVRRRHASRAHREATQPLLYRHAKIFERFRNRGRMREVTKKNRLWDPHATDPYPAFAYAPRLPRRKEVGPSAGMVLHGRGCRSRAALRCAPSCRDVAITTEYATSLRAYMKQGVASRNNLVQYRGALRRAQNMAQRKMQARYGGTCRCGNCFGPGEPITYDRASRKVVACPKCGAGCSDPSDVAYEDSCAEACGFSPFGGPEQ